MSYKVGFKSANLLKITLVTTAATLAMCVLAFVETTNTAEAEDSRRYNGKIAFISYRDRADALYTVEPDGSKLRQLTDGTPRSWGPVWSPDGTKIAFGLTKEPSGSNRISVMNADGSALRQLRSTQVRNPSTLTWLPDGTKLAFTANLPGRNWDIFVMDPDGFNLNNVTGVGTSSYRSEIAPAFSPDGSQMCVLLTDDVTNEGLYVMDADGSDPTALVRGDSGNLPRDVYMKCTWSPDGKKIAFSLTPEHEVFVINADGGGFSQGISNFTNLTSNSASDAVPAWSPDGTKIAFASNRDGDYDIYTMDADGSDVAQVTNLPGDDYDPDWQPLPGTTHPKDADGSDAAQDTKKPGVEDVDRDRPEPTVIVKLGDSLWSISEERLGPEASPKRVYDHTIKMYALNRKRIGSDPDLIFVGQRLFLPPLGEG